MPIRLQDDLRPVAPSRAVRLSGREPLFLITDDLAISRVGSRRAAIEFSLPTTVYSIVKQHQGWVEVFSQVGLGTTFKILLPAIPPPPKPEAVTQPLTRSRRGTETILLVEDDCAVRSITRRMVESRGYKVHEAACAREAVDV